MCLNKDAQNTKRYARTIRDKGGKIRCWKKVSICKKADEIYLDGIFYYYKWKVRWNKSDRKSIKDDVMDDEFNVYRGIHVYKRKPHTPNAWTVVIPVTCRIEDLVQANKNEDQAVFMKVFLEKKEYDKAIREYKNWQRTLQ